MEEVFTAVHNCAVSMSVEISLSWLTAFLELHPAPFPAVHMQQSSWKTRQALRCTFAHEGKMVAEKR